MRPYHPNNLTLIPYAHWRVKALAWVGLMLGVHFHVDGIPFGAAYSKSHPASDDAMEYPSPLPPRQ